MTAGTPALAYGGSKSPFVKRHLARQLLRVLPPSTDARAAPWLKIFRSAGLRCKGCSAASGSRPTSARNNPPQFHRQKPDRRHRICFLGMSPGFFLRLQLHHDLELANRQHGKEINSIRPLQPA